MPGRQRAHVRNGLGGQGGRGRRRHEAAVSVPEPGGRQEAAALPVQHERNEQRQQEDSRRDGARRDVIRVAGPQKQQGGVDRVHREVPHEQRHDSEAQHEESDQHAGQPDLETPDVEGLVGIPGVPESPDERGDDDGEKAARAEAVEKGDREHPADSLFRDSRKKADEKHGRPGKRRVEHVAVGHVGRRPSAEPGRHHVEDRLIGEKERGERVAEKHRREEALRLDAAPRKRAAEGHLPREALPVDRLGRRHDDGDSRGCRDGAEEAEHDLAREVRRQRARSVVLKEGQRNLVEGREQRQHEGDGAEGRDQGPRNVLADDLRDEDAEHREDRHEERGGGDLAGRLVPGAQPVVVPRPGLRHVHELAKRGQPVAGDRRGVPNRGVRETDSRPFVDEGPVRALGPLVGPGLDRLEGPLGQRSRGQEPEGDRAGLGLREPGAGCVLLENRPEPDQVPQR